MDKFSKTTEIDVSSINSMEEDTPKSGKAGKIIAAIFSLLLAVVIWIYVMETDTQIYEHEYTVAEFELSEKVNFKITPKQELVFVVSGTRSALADVDEDDLKVVIDTSSIEKTGEVVLDVEYIYTGDANISFNKTGKIKATVAAK